MVKPKYFSHDLGAKDDPKCMLLIEQLGLEGYGIFWVLVETLGEQSDYSYPLQLLSALSRKYNTTLAKMETVVKEYGLFELTENSFFFSNSFNKRMKLYNDVIEQRRIAGKKSGEARRKKTLKSTKLTKLEHKSNTRSTNVQQKTNICSTHDEQLNKTKLNKTKLKEKELKLELKELLSFKNKIILNYKNKVITNCLPKFIVGNEFSINQNGYLESHYNNKKIDINSDKAIKIWNLLYENKECIGKIITPCTTDEYLNKKFITTSTKQNIFGSFEDITYQIIDFIEDNDKFKLKLLDESNTIKIANESFTIEQISKLNYIKE